MPRIGTSSAPPQISTNCSTSLKMAERKPPKATYSVTAAAETRMLKVISQPSTTFITTAMANMFTPLIRIISMAKETAARTRACSP